MVMAVAMVRVFFAGVFPSAPPMGSVGFIDLPPDLPTDEDDELLAVPLVGWNFLFCFIFFLG
jgi:hypothetical protein